MQRLLSPITVILLIFLCLEGLLFFTFTAVMFGTQIHSICNDETEIERLKSEKPTWERRLRWEGMKSVFGGPLAALDEPLCWLPTATATDETQEGRRRVLRVRPPAGLELSHVPSLTRGLQGPRLPGLRDPWAS